MRLKKHEAGREAEQTGPRAWYWLLVLLAIVPLVLFLVFDSVWFYVGLMVLVVSLGLYFFGKSRSPKES
jgi:cytochrome c biogenesis protein ResB